MYRLVWIVLLSVVYVLVKPLAASAIPRQAVRLYVTPDGLAGNDGTVDSPLSFEGALDCVRSMCATSGVPKGGVEVVVAAGRYALRHPFVLGPELAGTPENPVRIRAQSGGRVIFDGGQPLDPSAFSPVTDPAERERLAPSARDRVLVATLTDPALIKRLSGSIMLTLSYDGSLHLPCVFPNDGYAYFDVEPRRPEVSPPAVPRGAVGYGVRAGSPPYQEPGKPQGWLGTLEEPRGACASFSESEAQMAGTWAQWEAELARDNTRNLLCGFIDANWLFRAQPIVSANASERWIHLSSALAYGWHWKSRPRDKPFRIYGLLCELDQPGEWHFDPVTNRLYILPENGLDPDAIISVPVAEGFLTIDGATSVEIIGIEVENVGGGTVFDVRSGSNNRILGCHVRNSTATGIALAGRNNGAFGCDLVDLDRHVVLRGGVRTPTQIIGAQNTVENCHIYQRSFRHRKVSVSISGVGNRFRHNLVHNSLGQAVTVSGNDHLIEFNELFNIGYDEGDGGAIYSGGDLAGYGIVYQYNFIHHLMHVPGKVERSGIHLDDLQAGATCVGNVFYKSASKGIFMNGGAGHTIRGNVFLEGYRGVYNVGAGAQRNYERQLAITRQGPSHDHWNTKENYVGRVEKIVGPEGWSRSPWKDRYPLFNEVMSDDGQFGRMWPIRCTVEGNAYYGNTLRNKTEWSRVAPEALAKSVIRDDRVVEPNDFEDYEALDLRQAHPARFALKIPFERIGLYTDEHRPQMPDKTYYRHAIKVFFAGIPSHPGTHRKFDSAQAVDAAPLVGK